MKNTWIFGFVALCFRALPAVAQDGMVSTPPSTAAMFFKVFFALLVTLLFIAGLAWFARRYQKISAPTQAIKIVAGVSLGQRERALLLQVGETQLLVGVSPGAVTTLHVLTEPVDIQTDAESESFAHRLKQGLLERSRR